MKKRGGFMNTGICIVKEPNGSKRVFIHDILFRGKRKINWKEVEQYLKKYIGGCYKIAGTAEEIYIGTDFPDEFCNSNDTVRLKGMAAKAKANAAQGIPQLIEVADNRRFQKNFKSKHSSDAENGWYRYTSKFSLPVYNEQGEILYDNIFRVEMLVRHSGNGKKYLYDVVNIKKETSTPH